MDLAQFTKRIELPEGFAPPVTLIFEDVVASRLGREHLHDDVAAINESLDLIARTRGGGWPTEAVTEDGNYIDLVWHECEFREGYSFSYAVRTLEGEYIGCCYFYPIGRRTPLSIELVEREVDISWWVTPSAHERGYYEKLFEALRQWAASDFPFRAVHVSNIAIPA